MTDAPDSQHHLDELASAHLDGQTSAADAARVADDPDLQARVAALRSARDAVASPTAAPDPGRREMAIAAALAAFDAEPTATAVVADLDARRHQRRRLQLLGAAAAAVLAALAVPLLAGLGDDADDQIAAEATAEDLRADDAGGTATEDAVASTTVAAPEAGPLSGADPQASAGGLGAFDELDQLVAAARAEAARAQSAEAAGSAPPACDGTPEVPDGATRLLLTTAVLDGTDVVVIAYDDAGARRLVVQDAVTCATLAIVDL